MYLQLLLIIILCKCQTQIDLTQPCFCEELENEYDCNYLEKCKYINNNCITKQCSELNQSQCSTIKACAWNKQKCQQFTSCDSYIVADDSDCANLNHDCLYQQGRCIAKQQPLYPCSALSELNCTIGTDGLCIYLNTQCQVWTDCSDSDESQCAYGALACYTQIQKGDINYQLNLNLNFLLNLLLTNQTKFICKIIIFCFNLWVLDNILTSIDFTSSENCNLLLDSSIATNSCKALDNFLCVFAFPKIGSTSGYICNPSGSNNQCNDFNPTYQNSQTCIVQSYGFYKWNGLNCSLCQSSHSYLISVLIILSIII